MPWGDGGHRAGQQVVLACKVAVAEEGMEVGVVEREAVGGGERGQEREKKKKRE